MPPFPQTIQAENGMKILVINGGSSSFKYQIIDMETSERICQGLVERIGMPEGNFKHKRFPGTDREETFEFPGAYPNHTAGMQEMVKVLLDPERGGVISSPDEIAAVGHRVLLGGPEYAEALVDEKVKKVILDYIPLGPLHNPANLAGIEVMEKLFPGKPNVAVFDTGFHATMPDQAYTYAIPQDLAKKHRIRRYGFHGTSHKFVSKEAAAFLGKKPEEVNLITCHLGNGSSICAVEHGKCVDTSMGLTPLEGLVMGTRSGSIDPAIVTYLMQAEGYSGPQMSDILNKQSGLKALCGMSDLRDLEAAEEAGDKAASLALRIFVYTIRKYIGAYFAVLGHVDAVVFTGGIGENSPKVRGLVCRNMDVFGIAVDEALNAPRKSCARDISLPDAKVRALVVPTDEELEIARTTMRIAFPDKTC